NRRAFLADADEFMRRNAKRGEPLSVMLADLDRFKAINDRFGHAVGDRVLQVFADMVRRTLRANDLSGRLGGEEFAFLMPGTGAAEAARIAERIRAHFADAARSVDGHAVAPTVSGGRATTAASTRPRCGLSPVVARPRRPPARQRRRRDYARLHGRACRSDGRRGSRALSREGR